MDNRTNIINNIATEDSTYPTSGSRGKKTPSLLISKEIKPSILLAKVLQKIAPMSATNKSLILGQKLQRNKSFHKTLKMPQQIYNPTPKQKKRTDSAKSFKKVNFSVTMDGRSSPNKRDQSFNATMPFDRMYFTQLS